MIFCIGDLIERLAKVDQSSGETTAPFSVETTGSSSGGKTDPSNGETTRPSSGEKDWLIQGKKGWSIQWRKSGLSSGEKSSLSNGGETDPPSGEETDPPSGETASQFSKGKTDPPKRHGHKSSKNKGTKVSTVHKKDSNETLSAINSHSTIEKSEQKSQLSQRKVRNHSCDW